MHSYMHIYIKKSIWIFPPIVVRIKTRIWYVSLKYYLYELKQSHRELFIKLSSKLQFEGFKMGPIDHFIFILRSGQGNSIGTICVNDIIIIGDNDDHIQKSSCELSSK